MTALNLLVHTVLMFVLPLGAFLYVRSGALDPFLLHLTAANPDTRDVAAGVTAVVAVQLVIASFLVTAWQETVPAKEAGKQD